MSKIADFSVTLSLNGLLAFLPMQKKMITWLAKQTSPSLYQNQFTCSRHTQNWFPGSSKY